MEAFRKAADLCKKEGHQAYVKQHVYNDDVLKVNNQIMDFSLMLH